AGKGTHEELLESCEVYRQIAGSQLSEEELAGNGGEKRSAGRTEPAGNAEEKGPAGHTEKEAFGHA
ncbi:MAG: hypothetical protein HFI65_09330, partial [Lachnospiraceae bacterium]|nr:hypothetical protein [Lachnospiraceae bacterium]